MDSASAPALRSAHLALFRAKAGAGAGKGRDAGRDKGRGKGSDKGRDKGRDKGQGHGQGQWQRQGQGHTPQRNSKLQSLEFQLIPNWIRSFVV